MLSRRAMLQAGSALLGIATAGLASRPACASESVDKRIALTNLHTGERVDVVFYRDGEYRRDALLAIESVLRDFRNDERHPVDPQLMDYLVEVAERMRAIPDFKVISGYRSPATNHMLHARSAGVAQHSLHMQGRAIDVRMAHVDCADLAAQALEMKRGGVGYYKTSNFVHLDTGAFRTWRG